MTAPAPDPVADVPDDVPTAPGELPPSKGEFRVLFLIVLVDMIGFGIILPILPVYAKEFNASNFQITLLFSVYSLCQFIASPILGNLSDRVGRRPVLIGSQLGSGAASLMLAYATAYLLHSNIGLALVYFSRCFDGFSGGNVSAAQAYISDSVAPHQKSKYLGLLGAAFGIGFTVGPTLGGVLGHVNPALAPLAAGACSIIAAVCAFFYLPESLKAPIVHEHSHLRRSLKLLRIPVVAQINAIWFVAMFAFVTAESVFALFMTDDFGFNVRQVGFMFGLAGIVIIFIQGGAIGPLAKRVGDWNLAALGPLVFTAAMVLYAIAAHMPVLPLLIVAVLCNAIGRSLQTPSLSAVLSHEGPADQQGAIFGLFQGSGSLARVFGPALAGLLYDHKHAYPYIMAGVLTLVAGVWTLALKRQSQAGRQDVPATASAPSFE